MGEDESRSRSAEFRWRILERLRSELRRRRGIVRSVEAELGKSPGYLAKAGRGAFKIPLDVLLDALEALGAPAGAFFVRALDAVVELPDLLADLASDRPPGAAERTFLAAARRLAAVGTEPVKPPTGNPIDPVATAAQLASGTRGQQYRRLKKLRYRSPEVMLAYLDHLDRQREPPRDSFRLAAAAVVHVVPHLEDGARSRVVIRALAVVGAARCAGGELPAAARALGLGLELSREPRGAPFTELLCRTARLLARSELPRHAARALREALEIAVLEEDESLLRAVLATRRELLDGKG